MRKVILFTILNVVALIYGFAQTYPQFGEVHNVTINGLTFDAMEPFLSNDEQYLFFNSLNSGGNTNLYYSIRINDTVFQFMGNVNGTLDTSDNHLDGVASLDGNNNFYWVSLRNYPAVFENLHWGKWNGYAIEEVKTVFGDFYIPIVGWLIMDATINFSGDKLIYCNAYFDLVNNSCGTGIPCSSRLSVANKVNDSLFSKSPLSEDIFKNINDTNYLVYAPSLSANQCELYFTRLEKGTINTEICVSVRNSVSDEFSLPIVLYENQGFVPEAGSISFSGNKLYYHEKNTYGIFSIKLRYRITVPSYSANNHTDKPIVYPNPAKDIVHIENINSPYNVTIINQLGFICKEFMNKDSHFIDLSNLAAGLYKIRVNNDSAVFEEVLVISR